MLLNKTYFYHRFYFVWKEANPDSSKCRSCFILLSEKQMAITSSIMCMMIVLLYWITSWLIGNDIKASFVEACLNPNGIWTISFNKWWAFTAIIGVTNGLSIGLCASFYIWLSLGENETTLITTKVGNISSPFKLINNKSKTQ